MVFRLQGLKKNVYKSHKVLESKSQENDKVLTVASFKDKSNLEAVQSFNIGYGHEFIAALYLKCMNISIDYGIYYHF